MHAAVLEHARKGCMSDKPGVNYYYFITTSTAKLILMCIRGTSKLEGFHMHLRRIFQGFHSSPKLATCLLAVFIYRWNISRAIERGLIAAKYGGWFSHDIILDICKMLVGEDGLMDDLFNDFDNCEDYIDTKESFFTPVVEAISQEESNCKEPEGHIGTTG